ncbi:MAG TPA: DUF2381 family protein [Myxococcales bacterium]|nr:DUF2381 family protein [Myxococcales bacterium]
MATVTGPCRTWISLCLTLAPIVATAQEVGEPPCYPADPGRPHYVRSLVVRQSSLERVPDVYVAGGVPTILHLPAKVLARGTGIRGGARRFKLVMGSDQVLVTPTRGLAKGERFPLVVALADGTIIPLSLTGAPEDQNTDGLVEISREPENAEELRVQLASMTARAQGFEVGLRQALLEQDSEAFSLAGLLAGGQAKLTPFVKVRSRYLFEGANERVFITTFAPGPGGEQFTSLVGAVFRITNKSALPLDVSVGRALANSADVPVAIRAQPRIIPPGGEGKVAMVVDSTAFGPDGSEKLQLDVFARVGREIHQFPAANLVLKDFTAPRQQPEPSAPAKSHDWWPF